MATFTYMRTIGYRSGVRYDGHTDFPHHDGTRVSIIPTVTVALIMTHVSSVQRARACVELP